jgi:drug/metabolite transporter (DMT)-like permease
MAAEAVEGPRDAVGLGLPFAAVLLLFAGSFPAYKAATDGVGVAVTSFVRFVVATVILLLLGWRQLGAARGLWGPLLLIGAIGLGGQALSMTAGIDAGTGTLGSLVLGLEPIGIAVVGAVALRERPTRPEVAGLLLGLAGIVVVSGALTVGIDRIPARAIAFLLLTVVLFSVFTIEVRRHSQRTEPQAVAAVTSLGATLFTLPFALVQLVSGDVLHDAGRAQVAALVYLGPATGLAYGLFAWLLARVSSTTLALMLYLLPPLGVIASFLVLGEEPSARDVVGGALILLAIWVARRRRADPPPELPR